MKKVIKKNGDILSTYYLRDASGNVMSVYEITNTDNAPVLSEQYIYGSSRLGVYNPTANVLSNGIGARSFGRKSYELSDHLGNVMATLSDYRRLASAQIVNSATDYYPFGMVARSYTSSQIYRFGYNGKEHEDDLTSGDYDFGARIYDSRLARWLAVDPLVRKYPQSTPYSFALNMPIAATDPTGEDVYLVIWYTAKGEIGHAGIAVDNYRKETQEVKNEAGEVIGTVEVYVPDGTVNYYDFGPGEGAGKDNFNVDQDGYIGFKERTTIEKIRDQDIKIGEKRPAEGLIRIETNDNGVSDVELNKQLYQKYKEQDQEGKTPQYNGADNNCSDW